MLVCASSAVDSRPYILYRTRHSKCTGAKVRDRGDNEVATSSGSESLSAADGCDWSTFWNAMKDEECGRSIWPFCHNIDVQRGTHRLIFRQQKSHIVGYQCREWDENDRRGKTGKKW